jgi:hypothetical protein
MTTLIPNPVIETWHKDDPVCPYCGYKMQDAWELDLGPGIEGDGETDCGECEKTFFVSRHCSVTYTTKAKP